MRRQLIGCPVSQRRTHFVKTKTRELQMDTLTFRTLDNQKDVTFNQLLGINNDGKIAGYFGSDAAPNFPPNKGYTLSPPYGQGNYTDENFGGSVQTQVTGINNEKVTVASGRMPLRMPTILAG
jgi:hypothetical protein